MTGMTVFSFEMHLLLTFVFHEKFMLIEMLTLRGEVSIADFEELEVCK